jgi:hypothetical protein
MLVAARSCGHPTIEVGSFGKRANLNLPASISVQAERDDGDAYGRPHIRRGGGRD